MVIIGIILTVVFGLSVVYLVGIRRNFLIVGPLGYMMGIGLQTLLMFYLAILNIKMTLFNVTLVLVISVLVLNIFYFWLRKRFLLKELFSDLVFDLKELIHNFSLLSYFDKVIICLLVLVFIFVFLLGLYWPVAGWDSIALYDFRARVFKETGYMWDAVNRGYFFGYPLMTSMMNTWVYLFGYNYPRFMYALIYISFSTLFYYSLRFFNSRRYALVFTSLLVLSTPLFGHSFFDYTNMPYAAYFFVGTAFVFIYTTTKRIPFLIIAALTMGIATWIRSTDPFWVANIVVLILWSVLNRKFLPIICYLSFFLPIQQSWNIFLGYMSQEVSTQALATSTLRLALLQPFSISRFAEVFNFVLKTIGPTLWKYALLLIFSVMLLKRQKIYQYAYLYLLIMVNVGILFFGSYIFSYLWSGWNLLSESLGRMSIIFIPLFLFGSGVVNLDLYDGKKN